MKLNPISAAARVALVACAASLAACEASVGPAGVDDAVFAVGDFNDVYDVQEGIVNVCVFPPVDYEAGEPFDATLSASATGGDVISGNFTIDESTPLCMEAWNATDALTQLVSANLESLSDGFALERIVTVSGDGSSQSLTGVTSATVAASNLLGAYMWFKLGRYETPPDNGGEGCTPGYWRQEHHYDSWTGYAPGDLFSSVFADAFPSQTLGDVVQARGGGLDALGRSAVAALLNATSAGVDYDYTADQVIELFNVAYASGDRRTIEDQKNVFDFLNNQGCGLD